MRRLLRIALPALLMVSAFAQQTAPAAKPLFTFQEVMVPMRDGAHLQTVILAPIDQQGPLPILLRRTPYGVPNHAPNTLPASWKELAQDGYIFVVQNLRGRFKSEGKFSLASDSAPTPINETTDAYDSIEWLIKNVPNNNGTAGM